MDADIQTSLLSGLERPLSDIPPQQVANHQQDHLFEPVGVMRGQQTISESMPHRVAAQIGDGDARNAASWYFDGNTPVETYVRTLRGIENGNPEILDSLPTGSMSAVKLAVELDLPGDLLPDSIMSAYEMAFSMAIQDTIAKECRRQLGL